MNGHGWPSDVWGPMMFSVHLQVLLCVLEQLGVENSSSVSLKRGIQSGAVGPIGLWLVLEIVHPMYKEILS